MEEPRRRTSDPRERWFDAEGTPAPLPRGAANQRRGAGPARWSPPQLLTWVLFANLVLLVLAFTYLKDESLPWEEDIKRPPFTQMTPDMSAPARMMMLLNATKKVDVSQIPQTPAWQWDTPSLARLLEQHGVVLDNFRDLLEEKEQEWQPRSPLWMIEDFGDDAGWRVVIVLKQAEAAYLARRGQEEPAFLAAMDLAVLAYLLERLDAWPSFMERTLELHERCAQSLAELLRHTQLSGDTLARLQEEEYKPWAPSAQALRNAMSGYYAYERKLLLGPDGGEPPLPPGYVPARSGWLFFKPHATLHLFADSFRELQSESAQTAFASQNQIFQRLQKLEGGGGGILPPSNHAGEEYFASRIRPYAAFSERHSLARTQHAAVMTLFAVRRFIVGEARVPQSASELSPKYLPAPVTDPFSGEPLRINLLRGLIYSVGTDLKDEGGRPTPVPLADSLEPTVEIGIGMANAVR